MLKKLFIALGGFVLIVLALGAVKKTQLDEMASAPHVAPLTSVSTIAAREVSWNPSIRAIGTLAPVEGIMLSADADGTIVEIAAKSGSTVKQGDLIVKYDVSVESAQLAAAEARAELARLQSDRASDLLAKQTISQAEADTANAQLDQALAEVAALQAQIAKKQVRAPFSGRIGIRQINVGQFVGRGAPLMPLQKLDPIFVNFNIPQRQLSALKVGQSVMVTVDAFAGQSFAATVTAINPQVDRDTRNFSVQATMTNPEEKLRAGMFVRVAVELPAGGKIVAVPATAIAYASYGNSVYIVETMKGEDGKEYLGARQQFVKLGATRGDLVEVVGGVKVGEQVVSSGVFKLRNNMAVQVNNSAPPTSSATPTPDNT
ncbi:MAG: efflux RND transporter periplasmic adaptor subunit [Cephaloticoccus sp.]|nr:efflux RND transporter periplasmic adaptor subunit [Cephaloticoccus sp.]